MKNVDVVCYLEFNPSDYELNDNIDSFKKMAYEKLSKLPNMKKHNWWQIEKIQNNSNLWYLKCCQITINNFNVTKQASLPSV